MDPLDTGIDSQSSAYMRRDAAEIRLGDFYRPPPRLIIHRDSHRRGLIIRWTCHERIIGSRLIWEMRFMQLRTTLGAIPTVNHICDLSCSQTTSNPRSFSPEYFTSLFIDDSVTRAPVDLTITLLLRANIYSVTVTLLLYTLTLTFIRIL